MKMKMKGVGSVFKLICPKCKTGSDVFDWIVLPTLVGEYAYCPSCKLELNWNRNDFEYEVEYATVPEDGGNDVEAEGQEALQQKI